MLIDTFTNDWTFCGCEKITQTTAPSFSVSKAQYDYGTYSFESDYISIIDIPYKNYKFI